MANSQEKKHARSGLLNRGSVLRKLIAVAVLLSAGKVPAAQTNEEEDVFQILKETYLSDTGKISYQDLYAQMPAGIRAFEKMDFDSRQVQSEFLCLKMQKKLFMDVVRYDLLKTKPLPFDPAVSMALEIALLGRSAMTVPQDSPIRETAKSCGLNRVCDFIDFKRDKRNLGRYFLDEKDGFYRGGLNAELRALDEINALFPMDDWLDLKRDFMSEAWHYDKMHPNDTGADSYHQTIHERARQKQQLEQHIFIAKERR